VANPYEIAIHISMQNAVSPVLALIAKDMLGLQMGAKKLEEAFGAVGTKLKLAVGGAAAAVAVGALRVTNEMRSVLGDINKAAAAAPMALKVEAMVSNATGKDAEGEGFKLWRAMEMKGITTSNPALTNKLMDALMQDIIGSGGKLDAGTYQQIARRGGAAWIHATPEFAAGPLSVLAADLGGEGAGTAIMTLRNLLTGATVMSKQQYGVLSDAGLIDKSKVSFNANHTINAAPGAIAGSLQYGDDPYAWAQFIKGPLMNLAKGDPKVFDSLLAKLGRNRNAIKMLTMFTDPGFGDQIAKDISLWSQAMGIDQGYDAMIGRRSRPMSPTEAADMAGPGAYAKQVDSAQQMADYTAVMKAFQAQWGSMTMAVGSQATLAMIPILQNLTGAFTTMGAFASAHGTAMAAIVQLSIALTAALAAMGVVAVGAAAGIPGLIAALAVALGALAVINWGAISGGLTKFVDTINAFFAFLDERLGITGGPASPFHIDKIISAASPFNPLAPAMHYGADYGREAANGRALMSLPVPVTNVSVRVTNTLDSRAIASEVSTLITRDNRTVNSSSGYDGSAGEVYPDYGRH
jgi:hypothetical protein